VILDTGSFTVIQYRPILCYYHFVKKATQIPDVYKSAAVYTFLGFTF